jgi:serine/threonine protein phosphatase PrpC
MVQGNKPVEAAPPPEEAGPAWDLPAAMPVAAPTEPAAPAAMPVAAPQAEVPSLAMPVAIPAEPVFGATAPEAMPVEAEDAPLAEPVAADEAAQEHGGLEEEAPPGSAEAPPAAPALACPVCTAPNPNAQPSCADCGYYFSEAELAGASAVPVAVPVAAARLQERYELGEKISERSGVVRYRGVDHGTGTPPRPVVIVCQELPPAAEAMPVAVPVSEESGDEIFPSFDDLPSSPTDVVAGQPSWPSVFWERRLLRTLEHPGLPVELDYFSDDRCEYLVEEVPAGRSLWDAWDDPEASARQRFGLLGQVAELLHRLHQCNTVLEGLRPDIVVVGEDGQVRLSDISDLLPIPVPLDAPLRGGLYTAPEVLAAQGTADARADLYSFGAMLYALHLGRELTEREFDKGKAGHPKPFLAEFPDLHPGLARLLMKTWRREVELRFPTDEACKEDSTGFAELVRTLDVLGRTYDNVRLEIASWTTTGIVRTGNEDAFALLHACESRQDDLGECALILLCDGMGGYEAGEVAAALAIGALRQFIVQQKPFAALAGGPVLPTDPLTQMSRPEGHAPPPLDVEAVKAALKAALKEANKQVFTASRAPGAKRRGMGCTAEAVYVDGRNVVVGHVGDSRTYHLHEGRMIQMTRDQTLVNRLVELGTLTPEEAETHPRRNELQQAIGGQPDVEPGLYAGVLVPGDWVVVCSDGLSNHISAKDLQQMLQTEATSAQMAARRLINLTNLEGATDNATVVVVRAT